MRHSGNSFRLNGIGASNQNPSAGPALCQTMASRRHSHTAPMEKTSLKAKLERVAVTSREHDVSHPS